MLERKYQRNRVPYEDILNLEKILKGNTSEGGQPSPADG